MQRLHVHQHHRERDFSWVDILIAWLIIGAVIAFNVIMMWQIATASG
jgi:hypothetical protein